MPRNIVYVPLSISSKTRRVVSRKSRENTRSTFNFDLCRKVISLGDHTFDQYWMRRNGLYGNRKTMSRNHRSVIDCFWELCCDAGSAHDMEESDIRETFLLAKLLPFVRSNASQKVFRDASLQHYNDKQTKAFQAYVKELDDFWLPNNGTKTMQEFYDVIASCVGPAGYEPDVFRAYDKYISDIMQDSSSCKVRPLATIEKWKKLISSVGRRSGRTIEKQALDILSYECRAAFHKCYSAVWYYLILNVLRNEFGLSESAMTFHGMWNIDLVLPSNESSEVNFHLFHGHIFGLHPAFGYLVNTVRGRQVIGDLISEPTNELVQGKFLNCGLVAAQFYAAKHDFNKEVRSGKSWLTNRTDLDS